MRRREQGPSVIFQHLISESCSERERGWKMPIFAPIQTHGAANFDEGDIFPPHPEHYTATHPTELPSHPRENNLGM